jgi:hypothetical protein
MIPVRSKQTGLTALVNERAFRHFAGDYERLDTPEAPVPAPAAESSTEPKIKSRGTAATKEEE